MRIDSKKDILPHKKPLNYKAFFLFLRIRNKTELKSSTAVGNKPLSSSFTKR